MIRKIQSIHLYWFHACLSKLTCCLLQSKIKHFKGPFMSLKLESLVQNGSNPSGCSCISQTHSYCHVLACIIIVALHWLCSPLFAGICPLSVDDVSMMSSMTPMKNYTIFRSARQAKPPCSFRYNPTLSLLLSFTALGQQRFNCYMLR